MNRILKYGEKAAVTKEERALPYFKYFERDMAPVPSEKLALLDKVQHRVVPFDKKNLFLTGEDEAEGYCQTGYGVCPDGTGFVANRTYMPGVTVDMMDWWFPWHSVGSDLRYKIWDPKDHYFARADRAAYVLDPRVPMKEKTWGVDHYIMEDTGAGPEFLQLCFKRPSDFGYDESLVGKGKCASLVCAIGKSRIAAAMTHKWYPYKEGILFCSRFWIGFGWVDGRIVKTLPEGAEIPAKAARGLYHHSIEEFTNLAAILPDVYRENRDNF